MSPFFGTKLAHSNRCSGFTNDFSIFFPKNCRKWRKPCMSVSTFFALHCQRVEPTAKGCSEWYYPKARLVPKLWTSPDPVFYVELLRFGRDWFWLVFAPPKQRRFFFLKVKQLWHSVSMFIVGSINGWIWKITPTVTIKSTQRLQQTKYEHN